VSALSGVDAPLRAEPSLRLFFALWPGERLRRVLAERVAALVPPGMGRAQRPDQLHLTLEFMGSVSADRLAAALEAAAEIRAEPFDAVLDALEYWRRPQVLCLVAREIPPALAGLVQALRAGLAARGFDTERRRYRAHLTVARKVERAPHLVPTDPVCWPATEFSLVESITERTGSIYRPLAAWPLQR